ncbi:MAG TPA: dTDP-4-dehydrorhamnose reductase [Phycisphaerae bacterium]|nr:dTDP-4-dehydrorhamnose reductase [Phycisphaerae bacterium]
MQEPRKRVIITGAGGLLGTRVNGAFRANGDWDVHALSHADLDITQEDQVARVFAEVRPDLVVHCAAYTRVDDCESHRALADAVNGEGAGIVARKAALSGARLIHFSTDYVFEGDARRPYREEDPPGDPEKLSAYGRSKLLGEERVRAACPDALIVRTAWVYGPDGACFPRTILKAAREKPELRVVNDQTGTPTYAMDLAQAILRLAETDARGIVHVTNTGQCTWYEFACELVRLAGLNVRVIPVTTEEFPRPARRPKYSVLDNSRHVQLTGAPMRSWREAAADYVRDFER